MELIHRNYRGKDYDYETTQGVIGKDYYKDHLVAHLHDHILPQVGKKDGLAVLDMATGHGYSAILMADQYRDRISKLVAYDINPRAVEMAHRNAVRHACVSLIDFRVGTIFEPLHEDEQFDLVLSALPPVPVTSEQLAEANDDVRAHHWVASTAGPTGRDLLDAMIRGAYPRLFPHGIIATATADFQNATRHTIDVMKESGLVGWRVGEPRPQKVRNTKLTALAMQNIIGLGYKFSIDADSDKIFHIETYAGKKQADDLHS